MSGLEQLSPSSFDLDHDPSWYNGPPYAVAESVFDEDGMEDCDPAPRKRTFDDSGKAHLVIVPRAASKEK
jgi:hypothetical protein